MRQRDFPLKAYTAGSDALIAIPRPWGRVRDMAFALPGFSVVQTVTRTPIRDSSHPGFAPADANHVTRKTDGMKGR